MTSVCEGCGAVHSDAYARVFGDSENVLHGCPDCQTRVYRSRGGTAGVEIKYPDRGQAATDGGDR